MLASMHLQKMVDSVHTKHSMTRCRSECPATELGLRDRRWHHWQTLLHHHARERKRKRQIFVFQMGLLGSEDRKADEFVEPLLVAADIIEHGQVLSLA